MLIDTRAAADTPEAARCAKKTARSVLQSRNTAVDDRDDGPATLRQDHAREAPREVEPMLAVMERTSPQGVAGALRGMAVRPDRRGDWARSPFPRS